MKVSFCLASWCRIVGVLKNRFRTDSFVILSSTTIVVVILSTFLLFLWRNISNFFSVALRIAQLSHLHSSKLQVIAQTIRCLENLLTVSSAQKLLRAPISAEAWEILCSMS